MFNVRLLLFSYIHDIEFLSMEIKLGRPHKGYRRTYIFIKEYFTVYLLLYLHYIRKSVELFCVKIQILFWWVCVHKLRDQQGGREGSVKISPYGHVYIDKGWWVVGSCIYSKTQSGSVRIAL